MPHEELDPLQPGDGGVELDERIEQERHEALRDDGRVDEDVPAADEVVWEPPALDGSHPPARDSSVKASHVWMYLIRGCNFQCGGSDDGVATQDIDGQWLGRANWRPSLTDFRIGWEAYGNGADTLWYDDVALGSSRIGC